MNLNNKVIIFSLLVIFNQVQAGQADQGNWFSRSINYFKSFAAHGGEAAFGDIFQVTFVEAVERGDWKAVTTICKEKNINPNIVLQHGRTPLHKAAEFAKTAEDAKVISALLQRGAQLEARDAGGRTPYHLARSVLNDDSMKFLILAGAVTDAKDGAGRTGAQIYASGHRDKTPQDFNFAVTPGSSSGVPSVARFAPPTPVVRSIAPGAAPAASHAGSSASIAQGAQRYADSLQTPSSSALPSGVASAARFVSAAAALSGDEMQLLGLGRAMVSVTNDASDLCPCLAMVLHVGREQAQAGK